MRRQSFPLDQIGYVFDLHVFHPYTLDAFDFVNRKADRVYLRNKFTSSLPAAITITAEWRRKDDIEASIERPDGVAGPQTKVFSKRTAQTGEYYFLGQPENYPLQDHILLVTCSPMNPVAGIDDTLLIFMGGLDPHETTGTNRTVTHTECLAYMYPAADLDAMRKKLGSIDFSRTL